ncbi:MAG: 30S ribosomal protein S16 [Flavobacteriales bacterium]|nr:30S ribosomal protein S16 [Flavobacteriales bacterium]
MATKIRLARHGKKGKPFFHIVVADSRSPRDGRFIEKIGVYNPTSNPATIDLNFDAALAWVEKGAEPSETCRAILSYKGILYKSHLNKGVKKGALTQAQADAKFEKWLSEKEGKIQSKRNNLESAKKADVKARLEAESKVRAAKEQARAAAAVAAPEAPEAPAAEESAENTEA